MNVYKGINDLLLDGWTAKADHGFSIKVTKKIMGYSISFVLSPPEAEFSGPFGSPVSALSEQSRRALDILASSGYVHEATQYSRR